MNKLKKMAKNQHKQSKGTKICLLAKTVNKKSLFPAYKSNAIVFNTHFRPFIMTVTCLLDCFFQKLKLLLNINSQNFPTHFD